MLFQVVDKAPYCAIKPLDQSAKFRCWTAQDYADDEPTVETLALKFGSIELADKFEEAFTLAKQGKLTTPVTSEGTSAKKGEASTSAKPVEKSPEKKPEAPVKKPESPVKAPEKETTPAKSIFGSGGLSGGGIFGGASSPSSGGGLFSTAASGLGGGDKPAGGGIFGTAASGGAFGAAGGGLFGGLKADDSKEKAAAPEKSKDEGGENELVEEEEVTQIEGWTAEVTLEVKDKVDTGEEDEEEMYSQRSKLFRMKDGEWKERGTGLAKLLKHRKTGAVRFLLRQEKTMKIVGNHVVTESARACSYYSS